MTPIIYHSALALKDEQIALLRGKKLNILRSFYPKPDALRPEWVDKMFLDSGAFSAKNKGIILDVKDYGEYLIDHAHLWNDIAGLDVIENPVASEKNQQYLDGLGIKTIPTFHQGSIEIYLHKLLEKYDHIAFGGMVFKTSNIRGWLDFCWNAIEKSGWKGKVHGFGMTNFDLIQRYPWYSVDSTTASRAGRVGVLITPWGQLHVSKNIKAKTSARIFTPGKIKAVMDWIKTQHGSYFPDLAWEDIRAATPEATAIRVLLNILYMESLNQ